MESKIEARTLAGDPAARQPLWPAPERAAHYRQQATQFVRMAEAEAQASARERLLELARQYARLAIRLAAAPES